MSHMYTFTEQTAHDLYGRLAAKGYGIGAGLSDAEVGAVEEAFNALLPPDLRILLHIGVITSELPNTNPKILTGPPYYPDWRNPAEVAAKSKDWIDRAFSFDIRSNGYWYQGFGEKPENTDEAVAQALQIIRTWPPLIPIHGHRYIPSSPNQAGNPVLSVWQATDTVYYGMSLLEYMNMEFALDLNIEKEPKKPVPFWGEAFDLDQVWQPPHPA